MAGCERVFHVASPFVVTVDDPERDLLRPAVEGTLGVLAAAHANGGIRRVVLTSSVAAIADGARSRPSDESDWNEDARIDRNPYAYSKTQAERAAWEFTESVAPAFDLIVMNPSSVIGPTLVPRINQSHVWFTGMTDGSQPALVALDGPMVDVRDVASAHLAAIGGAGGFGPLHRQCVERHPARRVRVGGCAGPSRPISVPDPQARSGSRSPAVEGVPPVPVEGDPRLPPLQPRCQGARRWFSSRTGTRHHVPISRGVPRRHLAQPRRVGSPRKTVLNAQWARA